MMVPMLASKRNHTLKVPLSDAERQELEEYASSLRVSLAQAARMAIARAVSKSRRLRAA